MPGAGRASRSELAEQDRLDGVVGRLLQHEVRAMARREHVLLQVREVDRVPEVQRPLDRLLVAQLGEDVEERARVAERRSKKSEKTVDLTLTENVANRVD